MAQIAKESGLKYIAITDHSVSLGIANGLSIERMRQLAYEIRAAIEALGPDFHILHVTEMEIRADGTMDYPDEVLAELDFVIASLLTGLSQPREQVTERLLNALNNPHVDMIGHPTGRLIGERAGADLDMDLILETAVRTNTILEVNANPQRLDLRDNHVRRALTLGAKISINTDAHHADQFELRHYGVATAQRGWATAENVINTWPLAKLLAFIAEK
jgi:DNA polymerase (family 10)